MAIGVNIEPRDKLDMLSYFSIQNMKIRGDQTDHIPIQSISNSRRVRQFYKSRGETWFDAVWSQS